MRDYCLHEASSRAAYGRLTWVVRVIGNWRMRKTLKQLAKLANHQLHDIGLPRAVLNQLIAQPLGCDVAWEYEREALLLARYGEISENSVSTMAIRHHEVPRPQLKPISLHRQYY